MKEQRSIIITVIVLGIIALILIGVALYLLSVSLFSPDFLQSPSTNLETGNNTIPHGNTSNDSNAGIQNPSDNFETQNPDNPKDSQDREYHVQELPYDEDSSAIRKITPLVIDENLSPTPISKSVLLLLVASVITYFVYKLSKRIE